MQLITQFFVIVTVIETVWFCAMAICWKFYI